MIYFFFRNRKRIYQSFFNKFKKGLKLEGLNSNEIIYIIYNHYNIKILKIEQILTGWENLTYKLISEENENYILRLSKQNLKLKNLEFEILTIEYLNKSLPGMISKIFKTKNNESSILINNRVSILFSFLNGIHITVNDEIGFNKFNIRQKRKI